MSTPRLYRKGDSFQSVSGRFSTEAVFTRIDAMRADLPNLALAPEMSGVLARALAHLAVAPADRTETTFYLRPHTVEELARLTDDELPRNLYHRFR